jgi:hypothetical protein
MQAESGVTFSCQGCGQFFSRSALKVASGKVYCAWCYPKTIPADGVKAPHVRVPKPEWRKR